MTLETSARPARPYCAAPLRVAVSQSGGRDMTEMREENRSCEGKNHDKKRHTDGAIQDNTNLHTLE